MLSKAQLNEYLRAISLPALTAIGAIKIEPLKERPVDADETWDFKYNPHYHLKDAKSAIVMLFPYGLVSTNAKRGYGRLASIGYHDDYHKWIYDAIEKLAIVIKTDFKNLNHKIFVDKHGLNDKDIAEKSGLGFIGKNALLINESFGSANNIGYLLTNLELENYNVSAIKDGCEECNRCEKACPTGALNNRTCTITKCRSAINQKKGVLNLEEVKQMGDWFYGCDICQYACPYNHTIKVKDAHIDLCEIMRLTKATFKAHHIYRAYGYLGLSRLRRNAMIILYKQQGIAGLMPFMQTIEASTLLKSQFEVLISQATT